MDANRLLLISGISDLAAFGDGFDSHRPLQKSAKFPGEQLGPLLFQFGYFNKKAFIGVNDFLARLVRYVKKLPKGYSWMFFEAGK